MERRSVGAAVVLALGLGIPASGLERIDVIEPGERLKLPIIGIKDPGERERAPTPGCEQAPLTFSTTPNDMCHTVSFRALGGLRTADEASDAVSFEESCRSGGPGCDREFLFEKGPDQPKHRDPRIIGVEPIYGHPISEQPKHREPRDMLEPIFGHPISEQPKYRIDEPRIDVRDGIKVRYENELRQLEDRVALAEMGASLVENERDLRHLKGSPDEMVRVRGHEGGGNGNDPISDVPIYAIIDLPGLEESPGGDREKRGGGCGGDDDHLRRLARSGGVESLTYEALAVLQVSDELSRMTARR